MPEIVKCYICKVKMPFLSSYVFESKDLCYKCFRGLNSVRNKVISDLWKEYDYAANKLKPISINLGRLLNKKELIFLKWYITTFIIRKDKNLFLKRIIPKLSKLKDKWIFKFLYMHLNGFDEDKFKQYKKDDDLFYSIWDKLQKACV